jgi:hypothetical protein
MCGLWAPRNTLDLDARRRFTLEAFSSSVSDAYLYRFDLAEKSLDFVEIKDAGVPGRTATATTQGKQLKLLQ